MNDSNWRAGQTEEIALFVPDRVAGSDAQCALRLAVDGAESAGNPVASWNGNPLVARTVQGRWVECPVGNSMVTQGTNLVTLTLSKEHPASDVVVSDLLLRISYR